MNLEAVRKNRPAETFCYVFKSLFYQNVALLGSKPWRGDILVVEMKVNIQISLIDATFWRPTLGSNLTIKKNHTTFPNTYSVIIGYLFI